MHMKSPVVIVLVIIVILIAAFIIYRTVKGPSGAKDFTHSAQPGGGKGPAPSGQMQEMPSQPQGL